MCIVVDLNTLPGVFNPASAKHSNFKPVYDWIVTGKGRAVYGGTKYKAELTRTRKYLGLMRELRNARRAVEIRQDLVDARENELLGLTGAQCDDQHIIAIL